MNNPILFIIGMFSIFYAILSILFTSYAIVWLLIKNHDCRLLNSTSECTIVITPK